MYICHRGGSFIGEATLELSRFDRLYISFVCESNNNHHHNNPVVDMDAADTICR